MRKLTAVVLLVFSLLNSGCSAIVATAIVASSIAAATVTTAGKVTVATVKTTGTVVASAVTTSGDMASLSLETAAKLARTGAVVAVDAGTGTITELPWKEGMQLYTAVQTGQLGANFQTARIIRNGRSMVADLNRVRAGKEDHLLRSRDVVELR